MKSPEVKFWPAVESEFEIDGLAVTGNLLGRYHVFKRDGRRVKVSLPLYTGKPETFDYRRYSYFSGAEDDLRTSRFSVKYLKISIDVPKMVPVHRSALDKPPNQFEDVGQSRARQFESMISEYKPLIQDALVYWLRVMRWTSRNFGIGADISAGVTSSNPSTVIIRRSDRKRVWVGTHVITLSARRELGVSGWAIVGEALAKGREPPLWFDYLAEHYHRLAGGDYPGAIISLAISCETLLRALLWEVSGKPRNAVAKMQIERANAQAIIGHLVEFLEIRRQDVTKWRKSELHQLFDIRNKLVHEGYKEKITGGVARSLSERIREFIELANERYVTMLGDDDPHALVAADSVEHVRATYKERDEGVS